MMCFIRGTVLYHGIGYVIVEQGGIGFKVTFPEDRAHGFSGDVELFLHEVIRDNEREFFGFNSVSQLEFFWKLVGVSGVGPRSAQKIVFSDQVDRVKGKIMSGDISSLTDVPGIGKKTAQKIILELKGALAKEPDVAALDQDAIEALVGLGYSRKDAEAALSGIEVEDTEGRIRAALKRLSL